MLSTFLGIDYGSKTSGNTVICYHDGSALSFHNSDKRDADQYILDFITHYQFANNQSLLTSTFLDAPLSLPGVYHSIEGFSNYHYRQCDIVLKAMSPLFLGGLTARAMELKYHLKAKVHIHTYEVYPKAIAQILLPNQYHKKLILKEIENLCGVLTQLIPEVQFNNYPQTQHQFDALLAWISGFRFLTQQHLIFGHEQEGIIIV